MNPKEKALELIDSMYNTNNCNCKDRHCNCAIMTLYQAKQCALVCVEQILRIKSINKDEILYEFWNEVEQELNKLLT